MSTTTQPAENNILKSWYYQDTEEEAMGIETIEYTNGAKCKRVTLSDGRVAISRRLKAKDSKHLNRMTGNSQDKLQDAMVALSTKINDKEIVLEDVEELWMNDALRVRTMAASLNFL